MKRKACSLAIVGSYPPQTGGVAVHVQRLCHHLADRGISYVVYNATSNSHDGHRVVSVYRRRYIWLVLYALTAKEKVIYFMSWRMSVWLIAAFMARFRRKRVILQLRNSILPDSIERSRWRRFWIRLALPKLTAIVCVSRLLARSAESIGVNPKRILYAPAFLPPEISEQERQRVSPQVWEFAATHEPLIAANGKVNWYAGQDLYGLDQLVELATRLKKDYPKLGIVVCFWNHAPEDVAYLEKLIRMAETKGVSDNILFNTIAGPFTPVLEVADLFVRPTNTDGDAISVREALYFGIPTIASDAVERPRGTIVFRTRDLDDFEAKVRSVLRKIKFGKLAREPSLDPHRKKLIDAYLDFLEAMTRGDGPPLPLNQKTGQEQPSPTD